MQQPGMRHPNRLADAVGNGPLGGERNNRYLKPGLDVPQSGDGVAAPHVIAKSAFLGSGVLLDRFDNISFIYT